MKEQFLITGVKSGIGRDIYERVGGWGLTRENKEEIFLKTKKGVDVIIHCAFNSSLDITEGSLYRYVDDNYFLTEQLTTIPHKKIIYFSTASVYPRGNVRHKEDEIINIDELKDIYAITKLSSEAIIRNRCANALILRCTGLLGKYARKSGNFFRIMEENTPQLSLAENSEMNYVLYSDVFDFISYALNKNTTGVYNIASDTNITIKEVVGMFGKRAHFGAFEFKVGNVNNAKAASILPTLRRTSKETIEQFLKNCMHTI